MAALNFNPQAVAPAAPREARPAGWYPAKGVIESDVVTTASGGQMVKLTIELQDGGQVWPNFNIVNSNPQAVEMAYADLSALCKAIGLMQHVTDTRQLHSIPFDVKLRIEKSEGYDDKNVVASGGYAPIGSKQDKYVRIDAPTRAQGAPFAPQQGFTAPAPQQPQQQWQQQPQAPMQQPAVPQGFNPQHGQLAQPQQFTPPAPVQQPVPQSPQQWAPQAPFAGQPQQQPPMHPGQQQAPQQFQQAPQQFQPNQPAWTQPR